ncbi:threonine--tRNA ligase, partial [Patescibacteria group bacterium]|nr:threonine--tRNA ligase [Patescibacteria group bacterium]
MPKRKGNKSVGLPAVADLEKARHTLAHLLATAVLEKNPKAKLGVGPAIEDGFYYDFDLSENLTKEDLPKLEKRIRQLIKDGLETKGEKVSPAKAKTLFRGQPYKLELIKDLVKENKQLTVYKTLRPGSGQAGEVFMDLCRGGHVKKTSEIDPNAFKLTRVAGAYWKGDEKNKQLQRVYGLAFNSKEELTKHIEQIREAEKRDHKILGPALDLFTFSDLVGPGLPLWTPKGTVLRNILDDFVWSLRKERGYKKVEIPHITKKELYEVSGHWDKFGNELFNIKTREGHEFSMKPMNCPHHIQILQRKQWSYRDIPQRYGNTTMCYRDEQTGELAGISRTRAFTQDDAHVFCREGQMKEEFLKIWDIVDKFYKGTGFAELEVRISGHDPKNFNAYLGTKPVWEKAEKTLKEIAKSRGVKAPLFPGEAAFYGPKIDFVAKDSIGREWQVATIQLDMNLPERFDIFCIDEKGNHERLVMIHAAIMGSIERFLSVLIEHHAGAFPVWMSPVQVQVLAVGEKYQTYAKQITKELEESGLRVELTAADETLGKRIREGEISKTPYLLVVGEKEKASKSVAVRKRGKGDMGTKKLSDFIKSIQEEV